MIDLKAGEGAPRTKLVAAALIGVAVVSIILVIWTLTRGGSVSSGSDEYDFLCERCGHHQVKKMADLPATYAEDRFKPGAEAGIDCPNCGGKGTAYEAFKCRDPACGKYYLTKYSKRPAGPTEEEARRGEQWDTKCPHCGTDPAEWDRKHGRP